MHEGAARVVHALVGAPPSGRPKEHGVPVGASAVEGEAPVGSQHLANVAKARQHLIAALQVEQAIEREHHHRGGVGRREGGRGGVLHRERAAVERRGSVGLLQE